MQLGSRRPQVHSSVDYRSVVLADSPLGYWRLGEAPGATTAVDSSGHGNDGTYAGTPTLGAVGLIYNDANTGIFCDGDDYITIGTAGGPFALSTGTLEAWIRIPTSQALDGNFRCIVGKQNAFAFFQRQSELVSYDWATGGSGAEWRSGFIVDDGVKHHVAFTFDSGVLGGSTLWGDAVARLSGIISVVNQASVPEIARDVNPLQGWKGYLDEVAIYDYKLPQARIEAHYAAGIVN